MFDKLPVPSQALPFFICIPFGFIIGILIKRLGSYPLTIEEVLMSVKQQGKINYHNWWKSLTLGLISLAAGGSIGPEASTTVLGSGMVNWLGDRLRLIAYSSDWKWNHFWDTIVSKKQLKKLPKFSSLFKSKLHQKVFCLIMVMIGVVGAAIVFKLFPEEGLFGIHHRHILWQWRYSMYVIILLIVGWSFGIFFLWSEKWSDYFAKKITISPIIKATIWGIVLALLTLITSYALYSGEFQIVPFVHQALQISPLFLLVIAVIKTLSTNIGFSLGWRGGKIFPSIFASVAVGAAIAQFLPIMPVMCVAITVSASIAVILGKPLLTAILLILLLPIELAPVILVSAYLAACLTKVSYSFRQKNN
ncbi:chloride channel protein [Lactobacillus crispatus]|uniref:chloride channel protein n=1 Tax=Lactobacillus crispatus TaxID=47770 RepID=UPI002150742D|nr:chloride channel protein [Lactobacillus crispatus]